MTARPSSPQEGARSRSPQIEIIVFLLLLLDPSMNIHTLMALLEKHSINYASLNAELGVPLLLKEEGSKIIGVKLWLLTCPSCSWLDFAVALYNSHMDDSLNELKEKYMPMTGLQNTLSSMLHPLSRK